MMKPKFKVRKGDEVIVTTGRDAGKKGEVIKVIPEKNRVLVRGINVVRKHEKVSVQYPDGGIIKKELPIHVSNVQHIDPKSGKPTRIGYKILKDGTKVRFAQKSGEVIA